MAVEVMQINAQSIRDDVVDLLWENRSRLQTTREEYGRGWDWRYGALSDGEPLAWVARDSDTRSLVGYIALYRRRYRIGGVELQVGVPGNLIVHRDHRTGLVGPRLVRLPRTEVNNGAFDMVVAFANPAAHPLFEKLGFHGLGRMHVYTDVRRCGPPLRRRLKVPTPIGPVLDSALRVRRVLYRRHQRRGMSGMQVRRLSAHDFLEADRSHWKQPSDRLVANHSGPYMVRRFVECPLDDRQVYGLVDETSGALEAYVVAQGTTRVRVWECQSNRDRLDEAAAISRVADALPEAETIHVPVLPDSLLADELRSLGFIRREPTDYVERTTSIDAYWLPSHPLAPELADTRRWNLWFGSNHY